MAGYFRVSHLGFSLPAGSAVLKAAEVEAVEAADTILATAEARAAAIVAEAEAAFAREVERGYRKGLADADVAAVDRLIAESAALNQTLRAVEHDLARVVVACVRSLVEDFDDAAKAEALLRSALKQLRREKRVQLRVSPRQVAHLRAALERIQPEFPEIELVDVVEDHALVAPRLIVEAPVGRVDADIGDRLDELERLILNRFRAEPAVRPEGAP
ncbi:type III secretion system stator protein SctL [Chthonobacter rhizosphaerae]|uniref:type III secretion system stator protein SctL n=1 Tax=Chthonobacter rhizosphaerae TaxID=2735553 RepID=UPI0015EF2E9C|nr:type III secretion system stator protein SctL [Chthonobacter rhizosphaerae]